MHNLLHNIIELYTRLFYFIIRIFFSMKIYAVNIARIHKIAG